MCGKPNPADKVTSVRCRPKSYPCPTCGRPGHRKRCLDRYVRSMAYGQILWLHVLYAEYRARCTCCKTFRSCPPGICPKADYDNLVRQAVLHRILDDGLNVARTQTAMKRDFLLELSTGFIYDCLQWGLSQINQTRQRRIARDHFSSILCIDELHLGDATLLLATDPIADRIVGYCLVRINDQAHLRCFLLALSDWGFVPKVVVTDGSNLYPALLQEVWPDAKHQLCVFHVLQDITKQVLDAVRRLRRQQARRGNRGRKRRRGRPSKKQQRHRQRRGPSNKEKATFVYKHRFLIVKRTDKLSERDWECLCQMFQYLPDLRTLWHFCREVYALFSDEQVARLARRRRTLLLKKEDYQEVPELAKALGLLQGDKFDQMIAFLESPAGQQVKTNNHVERSNRKIRFDEKVRYKWRSLRSLDRFLRLRLDRLTRNASTVKPTANAEPKPKSDSAGQPNSV